MNLKKSARGLWFLGAVFFLAALGAGVFLSVRGFEPVLDAGELSSFEKQPAEPVKREAKKLALKHFEVIYKNPAFSEPAPAPSIQQLEKEPEAADERALGFSLIMTLVGADSSQAVIADTTNEQYVKEVGEVFRGAEFLEIRDGEVKLLFRNKHVVLKVPRKDLAELSTGEAPPQPTAAKREAVKLKQFERASSSREGPTPSGPFEFTRAEFADQVKRIPQIMREVRVMQHRDEEDGSVDGLRILDIQPGSMLAKWGLRKGDIIMEVNAEPVTNLGEAIRLIQQVKRDGDDFFDITIERGGEEEFLEFDILE